MDWLDSGLQKLAVAVCKAEAEDYFRNLVNDAHIEKFYTNSPFARFLNIHSEYIIRLLKEEKFNAEERKKRYAFIKCL